MIKHNKLRNTGLIFEILSRMVITDAMGNHQPNSIKIIKKSFSKDSELLKELNLYQSLSAKTDLNPSELFELILKSKQKLDAKKLMSEKYNLVKQLKSKYDLTEFFGTRVSNYKLIASIYKILEGSDYRDPVDFLNCKTMILEKLGSTVQPDVIEEQVDAEWREQDPQLRNITFKILVKKFNEKYKTLSERQKTLLTNYINEDSSSTAFKKFIIGEVKWLTSKIEKCTALVDNEIVRIKLIETSKLLDGIAGSKILKDEQITSMLKYYDLIAELERLQ